MKRLIFLLVPLLVLVGCEPASNINGIESRSPSATPTQVNPTATSSQIKNTPESSTVQPNPSGVQQPRLAEIPVGLPKYDRDDWSHWSDDDRDCQNARAEVLITESLDSVSFRASGTCTVDRGRWFAAYTGATVMEASKLDVDHMVPLNNAHLSGGWSWDAARKKTYANNLDNPEHLIAVTAGANRSKSASGPESWRPERKEYWCEYATNWIMIKNRWDLSVTSAEWKALLEMLQTCSGSSPSIVSSTATPMASPVTTAPTSTSSEIGARTGVPLVHDPFGPDRNCADFPSWAHAQDFYEAAGGNNAHGLDRDRNGVACESLPGAP